MVSESKIGTLHVIIGSCWYSCYCACVSVHPCRYVLYVCCARTVLSYMWNVYLYCFMLHLERMCLSVRMYVRMPVCAFIPYYKNLNTPLFLADMTPLHVYRSLCIGIQSFASCGSFAVGIGSSMLVSLFHTNH